MSPVIICYALYPCTAMRKYVQAKKSCVMSSNIPNSYQMCVQTRIRMEGTGVSTEMYCIHEYAKHY